MQALEWCLLDSKGPVIESAVVIGCGAQHTAWQIGISETQRQAIYADPKWKNGEVDIKLVYSVFTAILFHPVLTPFFV